MKSSSEGGSEETFENDEASDSDGSGSEEIDLIARDQDDDVEEYDDSGWETEDGNSDSDEESESSSEEDDEEEEDDDEHDAKSRSTLSGSLIESSNKDHSSSNLSSISPSSDGSLGSSTDDEDDDDDDEQYDDDDDAEHDEIEAEYNAVVREAEVTTDEDIGGTDSSSKSSASYTIRTVEVTWQIDDLGSSSSSNENRDDARQRDDEQRDDSGYDFGNSGSSSSHHSSIFGESSEEGDVGAQGSRHSLENKSSNHLSFTSLDADDAEKSEKPKSASDVHGDSGIGDGDSSDGWATDSMRKSQSSMKWPHADSSFVIGSPGATSLSTKGDIFDDTSTPSEGVSFHGDDTDTSLSSEAEDEKSPQQGHGAAAPQHDQHDQHDQTTGHNIGLPFTDDSAAASSTDGNDELKSPRQESTGAESASKNETDPDPYSEEEEELFWNKLNDRLEQQRTSKEGANENLRSQKQKRDQEAGAKQAGRQRWFGLGGANGKDADEEEGDDTSLSVEAESYYDEMVVDVLSAIEEGTHEDHTSTETGITSNVSRLSPGGPPDSSRRNERNSRTKLPYRPNRRVAPSNDAPQSRRDERQQQQPAVLLKQKIAEKRRFGWWCIILTTLTTSAIFLVTASAVALGTAFLVGAFDNDSGNNNSTSPIDTRSGPTPAPTRPTSAVTEPDPPVAPQPPAPTTPSPTRTAQPTVMPPPSPAPTLSVRGELADSICRAVPENCNLLDDPSSPQRRALDWLADNEGVESLNEEIRLARYAFATLFFSTNGATSWRTRTNWLDKELPLCDWYTTSMSTVCNDRGEMVSFEMDYNGLQGDLVAELALVPTLEVLSIKSSGTKVLTGMLPARWGALVNLKNVSITGNMFTGPLPAEYGLWKQIENLDLSNNGNLSGELPAGFGTFVSATSINLSRNKFSGPVPASLVVSDGASGSNFRLKTLNLADNRDNGIGGFTSLPPEFVRLQGLENLQLQGNALTTVPDPVFLMLALEKLDLSNNQIRGGIPASFTNLIQLNDLSLARNDMDGPIIEQIGSMRSLSERLDISHNQFTGNVPAVLGNLVDLKRLYLNDNPALVGQVPRELVNLRGMRALHIENTGLNGPIPAEICILYDSMDSPPLAWADCSDHTVESSRDDGAPCFQYCCLNGNCACRYGPTNRLCYP